MINKGANPNGNMLAKELLPGLLLTLALAATAFTTWWLLNGTFLKFSALLWAFIYSIIMANLLPVISSGRFMAGIEFVSGRLMRYAIALLGLTVSASVWAVLGAAGIATVLINLTLAFTFGVLFCKYVLRQEDTLSILTEVGTAICGASAIAATGPALKAKAEEMGLSLAVVTLFGLIAMFAYPLLFGGLLADWLGNNPQAFGMWAGTGIHETAQVIAAGSQVTNALSIAISAKFIRIFMIGPMVFISMLVFQRLPSGTERGKVKMPIPWFAGVFIILTLVHLGLESLPTHDWWASFNGNYLKPAVTFLLAWAFTGVGLKVKVSTIRSLGLKAFLGGMAVTLVAGGTALLLVRYLWLPLSG